MHATIASPVAAAAPRRSGGVGSGFDPDVARKDARPVDRSGARPNAPRKGAQPVVSPGHGAGGRGKARPTTDDHPILFQRFFKSVGPRTYAAQVKRATNGNHYLVLMEGKRDDKNGEVRKTRLFIYSEDFVEFFRLVKSTAEFVKANPVPEAVRVKRAKFWATQGGAPAPHGSATPAPATADKTPTLAPRGG